MKFKRIPIENLEIGTRLVAPILDPHDTRLKLLGSGVEITDKFMKRLKARHVDYVFVSHRDLAMLASFKPQGRRTKVPPALPYVQSKLHNDASREIDDPISIEGLPAPELYIDDPIQTKMTRSTGTAIDEDLKREWTLQSDQRITSVLEGLDAVFNEREPSLEPFEAVAHELVTRLVEDIDALVSLAIAPYESEYPSRHGVHLASLSVAIGATMGLDQTHLIDLAVGCLIHDAGMTAVGVGIFETKKPLSPNAIRRLADHPVRGIELAMKFGDSLSEQARFVIYQIHERCDGSGYPRGRSQNQIHPLARIAAVADAFIGMVSKRKHRMAIVGYHAIVALLDQGKQGKFDPLVLRALLETTSLHPLGSMVHLSGDRVGRVIRAGGANFLRPTVEMWEETRINAEPTIVNLAEAEDIAIISPLVPKAA